MQKPHPEIIIIKRRKSGGHDAHHGGAWKIAYADFVTAMMAFFLVMWLINASNEETKAAVASYFNPVQLMDTTSNPKGIKDSQYGASSKDAISDQPKVRSDARSAVTDEKSKVEIDDSIFRDPYAILTEIAGGAGQSDGGDVSETPVADDSMPRPGLLGGEAYRDPFEPEFWAERENALPAKPSETMPEILSETSSQAPLGAQLKVENPKAPTEPDLSAQLANMQKPKAAQTEGEQRPEDVKPTKTQEIADELNAALSNGSQISPQLSVETGDGTVTINLTDNADYSMFELGSAKPKREVIELVARIAGVLNSKPGMIEIAGHTDARPFKSGAFDNWRLSSARAQMAYYMLVRAGVSENRFGAIIGHASAKPKLAANPLAAENRRIEITLITAPEQKLR